MIASLFVGAAGFLLIFVAFRDGEQPGLITFSDNVTVVYYSLRRLIG